jgi:DNA primase
LPAIAAGKRVCIATDADPPGDAAAVELGKVFARSAVQTMRLRPPFGKDWNDVLRQWGTRQMQRYIHQNVVKLMTEPR